MATRRSATSRSAALLGRKGGRVISEKKLAALRENAKKAGRKPKFSSGDRVRILETAPASVRGRHGIIVGRGPGRAEYQVGELTGDGPASAALRTWWIEKA